MKKTKGEFSIPARRRLGVGAEDSESQGACAAAGRMSIKRAVGLDAQWARHPRRFVRIPDLGEGLAF